MFKSFLFTLTLLLSSTVFAQDGDSKAGKKIYEKIKCMQCHRKNGMGKAKKKKGKLKLGTTRGPRIAGLSEAYIVEQMTAIRDGKRKTKYTGSMKVKVRKLSDQDIKDLATYVSNDLNKKAGSYIGMLEEEAATGGGKASKKKKK